MKIIFIESFDGQNPHYSLESSSPVMLRRAEAMTFPMTDPLSVSRNGVVSLAKDDHDLTSDVPSFLWVWICLLEHLRNLVD